MTQRKKLLDRLLSKPRDFSWNELETVLKHFGYEKSDVGKTSGSRVRFLHDHYPSISLHKPHPQPLLKHYQLNNIIDLLKQEGLV